MIDKIQESIRGHFQKQSFTDLFRQFSGRTIPLFVLVSLYPLISQGVQDPAFAAAVVVWAGSVGTNILASWLDDFFRSVREKPLKDRDDLLQRLEVAFDERLAGNEDFIREEALFLKKTRALQIAEEALRGDEQAKVWLLVGLYTEMIQHRTEFAESIDDLLSLLRPVLESLGRKLDSVLSVVEENREMLRTLIQRGEDPAQLLEYLERASSLPALDADFVGRDDDLEKVTDGLRKYLAVGICGMGGVGKTALAKRAIHEVADQFSDGVAWVVAATLDTEKRRMIPLTVSQLASEIAGHLGCREMVEKQALETDRVRTLIQCLRGQKTLVALDNVEEASQVRPFLGLPDTCALLFTTRPRDLLSSRGRVKLVHLPVLPRQKSIELLALRLDRKLTEKERDQANEICDLLGDLPLAVRLAAGYIFSQDLTLGEFLERLKQPDILSRLEAKDATEKEESIRITFDLSWSQLSKRERRAFIALGALTSSGSSDAVRSIGMVPDVDSALDHLVVTSLVERFGEGRFGLHPVLRLYSVDKFAEGRFVWNYRMIEYYSYYVLNHTNDEAKGFDALEIERENIYAVFQLCEEQGLQDGIMALAGSMFRFLAVRGYWQEERHYLEAGLKVASRVEDSESEAVFAHNLGNLESRQGNYKQAEGLYQRSLEIFDHLSNRCGRASILHHLGIIQQNQGKYLEADELFRESRDLSTQLEDKGGIARSLHHLGVIRLKLGDQKGAERFLLDSLELSEQLDNKPMIARTLHQLGVIRQLEGKYCDAQRFHRQSLELSELVGDRSCIGMNLHELGMIQHALGNNSEAENLYQQSLAIMEKLSDKTGMALALGQLGQLRVDQGRHRQALPSLLRASALLNELDSPELPTVRNVVASIACILGQEEFENLLREVVKETGVDVSWLED